MMNEIIEKLKESIRLLENQLYNEDGTILDSQYLSDQENKIKLLTYYEEKLNELNEGKTITEDIMLLKEKTIPNDVIELAKEKNDKKYQFRIPFSDDNVRVFNGTACQLQHSDGVYRDVVVLYRGFSKEFNTDFIAYVINLNSDNKKIAYSPIIQRNGIIMKGIDVTSDENTINMKRSFANQFKDPNSEVVEITNFPAIVQCILINQYEEYIEKGINSKTGITNISSIKDEDDMYRYKVTSLPMEYIISAIKKSNSDITIAGETIEGQIPGQKIDSIITMSKPLELINIPQIDLVDSDNPTEKTSIINELNNRLKSTTYKEFINQYKPQYEYKQSALKTASVEHFIADLKKANSSIDITLNYDEDKGGYKVISSIPLTELNPVSNPKGEARDYQNQYSFDKDGYLISESQKLIKYECDESNNCIEKRPYYVDEYIVNEEKKFLENPSLVDDEEIDSNLLKKLLHVCTDVNVENKKLSSENEQLKQQIAALVIQNQELQKAYDELYAEQATKIMEGRKYGSDSENSTDGKKL